jgi:hypothetical protein
MRNLGNFAEKENPPDGKHAGELLPDEHYSC